MLITVKGHVGLRDGEAELVRCDVGFHSCLCACMHTLTRRHAGMHSECYEKHKEASLQLACALVEVSVGAADAVKEELHQMLQQIIVETGEVRVCERERERERERARAREHEWG